MTAGRPAARVSPRSRPTSVATAVLLAVSAALPLGSGHVASRPVAAQETPPAFGGDGTYCRLDDPAIDESSGLATSTRDGVRLWTHNDSGDEARLYALGPPTDGVCRTVGVLRLRGIDPFDAEDLAPGPNSTLWLADIGDNIAQRERIVLDRVVEPGSVTGTATVDAARFRYRYPDGAHDAEALLVAPDGQVVVVTKGASGRPAVYEAAGRPAASTGPAPPEVRTLVAAGELNAPGAGGLFSAITGGTVAPDGRSIVLRTYLGAYSYAAPDGDLVAALRSAPRQVDLPAQPQGEAVAFSAGGRGLLLSSEGSGTPLIRLDRQDGAASPVDRLVGTDGERRPWLVGGAAVLVLVVVVLLGRRRRRRS